MKNFFRRRSRQGEGEVTEAATTQNYWATPEQPSPPIAEAIPLETQKRMLHNIRRNLHSQATHHPP